MSLRLRASPPKLALRNHNNAEHFMKMRAGLAILMTVVSAGTIRYSYAEDPASPANPSPLSDMVDVVKKRLTPSGPQENDSNVARDSDAPAVHDVQPNAHRFMRRGNKPVTITLPKDCPRPDALGTSRVLEVGTHGGLHIGLKTYPQTLDLQDKEIALTFDDGPSPASTEAVLDALATECVRASFFLIGRNARAYPALVRREIAEGHTVGHHSWSHPEKTLRGLSETSAIQEITRGISADQTAAYGQDGSDIRVPFFRFPGFADTPATRAWLDAHNVAIFGADLWASDWNPMKPEVELKLLMGRLKQARRGIILLHDVKQQTAQMLPMFLQALKQEGYHVVELVPASRKPDSIVSAPTGWTSETEAILAKVMPKLLKIQPTEGDHPL
jgi:peptidoglycan-N-acetylglucosamine deacetylase